ncbi:hydratase [Bradyrhizobium sp. STM 3557]|uniref:hydratase n=1 Tax=Bradyrhizobium sp. STM 3557 TaxID=578920 RepID=UPI00388FFF6D
MPQAIRPANIDQGYDVQDRLVDLLGVPVVGWKLGVGSAKLKQQSGVGRSIAGRVLKHRRHDPGATVKLSFAAPVTIEFEIAFVLEQDIDHRFAGDLRSAIAEARVTCELVMARFVDRQSVGWPSFAADNSGFEALIVGERIDERQIPELLSSLVVSVDGHEKARAARGDDATDPYGALADLVSIARERKLILPKGSIISTGSASMPFAVSAPQGEVSTSYLGRKLGFSFQAPTHT